MENRETLTSFYGERKLNMLKADVVFRKSSRTATKKEIPDAAEVKNSSKSTIKKKPILKEKSNCSTKIEKNIEDDVDQIQTPKKRQNSLSEYEKMVEDNIAERKKFLQSLNILEAKQELANLIPQKKKFKPRAKTVRKELLQQGTRRRSLRIQNIVAILPTDSSLQGTDSKLFYRNDPVEHFRPSPGPANLQTYYRFEDQDESKTFISNLNTLKKIKPCSNTIWAENSDQILKNMIPMKITEEMVEKVVPQRIFSIKVHPTVDRTLIFAGGKWGELGVWNIDHSGMSSTFHYNIHSRPINCMSFDINNSNILYTTSYDFSVRKLDLVTSQLQQIYGSDEEDGRRYSSWHAQQDANSFFISEHDGLIHIDIRCPETDAQHYPSYTKRSVKVVTANPFQAHLLATAAADGYVCLWDSRKMGKNPLSVLCHGRSVSGLEFSPITGTYLLSTCIDNKLRIIETTAGELKVTNKIPHNNQTGRWLTTFKASWLPMSEEHFVVGSMNHPRRIEVYNIDGSLVHTFGGDFLQSVCSVNSFHPSRKILAGGNSSGKVHIFRDDII